MHAIVFTHVTLSIVAVLSYLLFFLWVLQLFWCYFLSWKPFNCFRFFSYRCSWYYSQGFLTKITLQHLSFYWERFWGILGLILWYDPLFLRVVNHLILWDFVQMSFALFHSQFTKKSFTALFDLLGALCNIFRTILGILFNVLRETENIILLFFIMSWYFDGGH